MSGLARQATWLSGGRIIAAAFQAITIVVVARATAPLEFGIVVVLISFLAIPQVFFDAGISTYSIRERALNPTGGRLAFALQVGTFLASLMGLFLFAVIFLLGILLDSFYYRILPLAIWAAAERNADLWLGLLVADGDSKKNVVILTSRRLGAFLLTVVGLLASWDPVFAYSSALAVSALLGSLWARLAIRRTVGTAQKVPLHRFFRRTRHYWVNSISAQARNLDGIIVTAISGPLQGGFYSMSTRLINPLKIVPDSLGGVLLPASSSPNYDPKRSRRLLGGIAMLLTTFFGIVGSFVPWFVPTFLGSAYVGSIPCMQIIVAGLAFSSISSLLSALLMGRGKVLLVSRLAAATTVFCLAGVAIGALLSSSLGAAMGAAAAFLVQALLLAIASRKHQVV